MALLVDQLQWLEPLAPETIVPEWEAEVRGLFGGYMPAALRRVASSTWVRRAYLDFVPQSGDDPRPFGAGAGGAGHVAGERLPLLLRLGAGADEDDRLHRRDDRPHRAQRAARRGRAARARAGAFLPQPRPVQAAPEPAGARADARGRLQRAADRGAGVHGRDRRFLQPRLDPAGGAAGARDGGGEQTDEGDLEQAVGLAAGRKDRR